MPHRAALRRLQTDLNAIDTVLAEGAVELPLLQLGVEGYGPLAFPSTPEQSQALATLARPAPFGRGPDTIYDPAVRRCGQIDASHLQAEDPRWQRTLADIAAQAAADLGLAAPWELLPYKLLIYGPGDHFTLHRDSEKAPGMVATLIIGLPSAHRGGSLTVRRGDLCRELCFASADLGLAPWVAFWADCQHAVAPVEAGWRIVWVGSLCVVGPPPPQPLPFVHPDAAALTAALADWPAEASALVVVPLRQVYSAQGRRPNLLKGADAHLFRLLEAVAAPAGLTLRLAALTLTYNDQAVQRREGDEAVRLRIGPLEDIPPRLLVRDLSDAAGASAEDVVISVAAEELCSVVSVQGLRHAQERFYEDTGNEGVRVEQQYHRAALLLWPTARTVEVWLRGGREWLLSQLPKATEPATITALADGLAHRDELLPGDVWTFDRLDPTEVRTLEALAALPDRRHLCALLRELVQVQLLAKEEVEGVLGPWIATLSPTDQIEVLTPHASEGDSPVYIVVSTFVLFHLKPHLKRGVLRTLLDRLLAKLRERQAADQPMMFMEAGQVEPSLLISLLKSCQRPDDDAILAELVSKGTRSVLSTYALEDMRTATFRRTLGRFPALKAAVGRLTKEDLRRPVGVL